MIHNSKFIIHRRGGFTLIEMLIVIAVIAILSSAVLVGLGPVQRQARDSRRISDLRQVQNGLELYYAKCGYYPGAVEANTPCVGFSASADGWAAMATALTGSNIGVNKIPNDPTGGREYFYAATTGGSGYVIGARLEDDRNPALTSGDDADGIVNGIDCADTAGAAIYCIQF